MEFGIPSGYMRIQGIGIVKGTPAKEIKVGNSLMWNYGSTSTVKAVEPSETRKTLLVVEDYKGKEYSRKMGAERLVCILDDKGKYTCLR